MATFASYVAVYGLIKIAGGNPQPEKQVKEGQQQTTTQDQTERRRGMRVGGKRGSTAGPACVQWILPAEQLGDRSQAIQSDSVGAVTGPDRHPGAPCAPSASSYLFAHVFSHPLSLPPSAPVKVVRTNTTTEKKSASGYQAPTADNIGKWLDNPDNMKQWEKSL